MTGGLDYTVVRTYFEQFSTSTVIRAFNFIRTSSFLAERLFWISILVGFTCLTIWNVTETVKTFLSEPTASHVSYAYNVTVGINFSETTICMQMHSGNLLKRYEPNIDLAIADLLTRDFVPSMRKKLDAIHDEEDKRAATLQQAAGNLNASERRDALLASYHNFRLSNFHVFTANEITLVATTCAMFMRLISLEMDTNPLHKEWQSPSVRRLYEAYLRTRTNFDQLFELITGAMCVLLQIRLIASHVGLFTDLNRYEPYNFCKHLSSPVYFGLTPSRAERVCYRLAKWPKFQLVFYSTLDDVIISAHPAELYGDSAKDLKQISLDLAGGFTSMISLAYHRKQSVDISLQTLNIVVSLRRRGCWTRDDRIGMHTQCGYWCRAEAVLTACDCRPLMHRLFPKHPDDLKEDLPDCAALVASKQFGEGRCQTTRSSSYAKLTNCSHECCERDCESMFITTAFRPDDLQLEPINATTVVKLRSVKPVYEKINEYVTMDAKAFVASLGGNLSLYLGASFLALIHIVVFFVKFPFECMLRRGVSQKTVAAVSIKSSDTNTRHLESMLKILVDDISSLRRYDRMMERRFELIELELKLLRGALAVKGIQLS